MSMVECRGYVVFAYNLADLVINLHSNPQRRRLTWIDRAALSFAIALVTSYIWTPAISQEYTALARAAIAYVGFIWSAQLPFMVWTLSRLKSRDETAGGSVDIATAV